VESEIQGRSNSDGVFPVSNARCGQNRHSASMDDQKKAFNCNWCLLDKKIMYIEHLSETVIGESTGNVISGLLLRLMPEIT
jgi:hypothetical protein